VKKPQPFIPADLPPKLQYADFFHELIQARGKLGELNGAFGSIKNPQLVSAPFITKEAVYSSQIEGTQATLEDVYRVEAQFSEKQSTEIEKDVKEIGNYREAIQVAILELKKYPISSRLIRKIHEVLLDSVRGSNKDRGNFRKIQVYIGKPGVTIEKASFIPPPSNEIPRLISNWEHYIHSDHEIDPLILAGVAHYQFEAIHPFLDGNGRIGRILIPLILYDKNLIRYPSLFISQYFEEHRSDYYQLLNQVSTRNNWSDWLMFFFNAIYSTSNHAFEMINQIRELYEATLPQFLDASPSFGLILHGMLFDSPFISFMKIKRFFPNMNSQSIYNLLSKFEKSGIIQEITGQKRSKTYKFTKLIEIIK